MNNPDLSRIAATFLILSAVLGFALAASIVLLSSESRYVRKTCPDFATYREAEASYDAGNLSLDGHPHNGIPCEGLLRHEYR